MAKGKSAPAKGKAPSKSSKPLTKSELFSKLAEEAQLDKKQVAALFDCLSETITQQLKGPGVITIPGLLKLKTKVTPAVKGGQTKINPLTKTEYVTKDKPKQTKVTARPLKGLKEALNS